MKVLVGSVNPVKIEAAREALAKYFENVEVVGIAAESGVADQPMDDETYLGAENRAAEMLRINEEKDLGADLVIGIEGGITKIHSRWFAFGAICVMDRRERIGFGASPHIQLPDAMVKPLLDGKELGDVTDIFAGEKDTKKGRGAVGFLTNDRMNRKEFYVPAIVVALAPFVNEKAYA
jgi:inosine/xanthosine triphosphatase